MFLPQADAHRVDLLNPWAGAASAWRRIAPALFFSVSDFCLTKRNPTVRRLTQVEFFSREGAGQRSAHSERKAIQVPLALTQKETVPEKRTVR
jgi:hypothetical protein